LNGETGLPEQLLQLFLVLPAALGETAKERLQFFVLASAA